MNVKSIGAIAVLLALGSVGAQAVTVNWGTHGPVEVGGGSTVPVGAFADLYTFSIAAPSVVASTTVANNISVFSTTVLDIIGGTYSLYQQVGALGGGDDISKGAWSFSGTTGSTSHSVTLGSGSFYYVVSGLSAGSGGGLYTIASSLAPVPEPETYAMMLAGLAAVGFLARRRQNG